MALKIRILLLLMVLGIAASYVKVVAGNKACDWPRGTCTYIYDPCPPYWERCAQFDYSCPLDTNHCCCRKRKPGTATPPPITKTTKFTTSTLTTKPQRNLCDWPRGTCTYVNDSCPPDWHRCPQYDHYCRLSTNHCCCRNRIPTQTISIKTGRNLCDWPRGTCTYIYDPCPPNWHRCREYDDYCTVSTNHCCCRDRIPARDVVSAAGVKACDWARGVCTYVHDPCPPHMERCARFDYSCPLSTNHCCCRRGAPGTTTPAPTPTSKPRPKPTNKCDWGRGTCTYIYDVCPPDWHRCPQYDNQCKVSTNHCCCRNRIPARDVVSAVRDPAAPVVCDASQKRTCWFREDETPCPQGFKRCPEYDDGCENKANWCCCPEE